MLNSITNSKIKGDEEESQNIINKKATYRYSDSIQDYSQFNSYLNDEANYTDYIIQGSQVSLNHKYNEAYLKFQSACVISKINNDKYKLKESLCHFGIIEFLLGKPDSIHILSKLFDEFINEMNNNNFDIDSMNLLLFSKTGSNLVLIFFLNNQLNKCIDIMNSMIDVINKQKENLNKITTLQNIIFILFRCKSLIKKKSNDYDENIIYKINESNDIDEDKIIKYSIHKLFGQLNNYLETNNFEKLFTSIVEIKDLLKKINDYNGLIFLIYLELVILHKNKLKINNINESISFNEGMDININISALFNAIQNSNDNEFTILNNVEDIKIFHQKCETALKIYNLLYENEKNIYELINQENNIRESINYNLIKKNNKSSQGFFKQFLINIINQIIFKIEKIENNITKIQVISQLQKTINILENNNNIYFSKVIMEPCLKIIQKTIENKLNNIIKNIYNKRKKAKYFKLFHINSIKILININNDILKKFYEYQYKNVIEGNIITKFNMGNNGIKEHFYIVNQNNEQIDCYKNKYEKKPYKSLKFNQINKITFGLKSNNLLSKINQVPHSYEVWKILSFITNKNSLDFIFNSEVTTKKWFYGIQYILKNLNFQYKINSTTGFIIIKLKMKLSEKLGKNTRESHKLPFLKTILKYCVDNNI